MTDHITTINPATEAEIERYPYMSDAQMHDAIEACHTAFVDWSQQSLEERAKIIKAVAKQLREDADEFAALMTRETGKLLRDSKSEIELCAQICDYTAEHGPRELAPETRQIEGLKKGMVTYSPVGIIYGIQPWNFPCYQAIRYAVANLMAGNGVLLKHAANCTGSGLFLRDVFEKAGLPENLFTVLIIDHDQSDAVIAHKKVRGVTLTGSDKAGRIVGAKAAENLKKTVLELGSNDAYIVLSDADLDHAVKTCVKGRLFNNGETCVNAKRFIVVDELHDAFLEAFVKAMKDVKLGDPTDGQAELGPIVDKDMRDELHKQTQDSIKAGAKLECGGEIPDRTGYYYPATVLSNVKPGQPAYDDELFGPVASVIRAKDDEDAMRLANDSRYGLGGGIFSRNEERAIELARDHFDTGMVQINGFGVAKPGLPFGGVKDSGYGREHGGFGIKEFVNIKAIHVS